MSEMKLTIHKNNLNNDKGNGGLEINIPGCKGNPTDADGNGQIFIEHIQGKVLVHVWNDKEDPKTLTIDEE